MEHMKLCTRKEATIVGCTMLNLEHKNPRIKLRGFYMLVSAELFFPNQQHFHSLKCFVGYRRAFSAPSSKIISNSSEARSSW